MNQSFLLVQSGDEPPSAEQMVAAFKAHKKFTEADAIKAAREAHGVILKNLAYDDAQILQQALAAQGAGTAVVAGFEFPQLPAAKVVRRLEFQPETLVIYDALGRPQPFAWSELGLVAAGAFQHFELGETQTEEWQWRGHVVGGYRLELVTETRHHVSDQLRFLVDLLIMKPVCRLQIEPENFLFGYVFDRPQLELSAKVALLVQMLKERAPKALQNRGAVGLCENPPVTPLWPNKTAFFEEESWLIWRLTRKKESR